MSHIPGISLGIYEKGLPGGIPWPERLRLAAEAGFDFVEMSLDPSEERLSRLAWSGAQRRALRRAAEDVNVRILTMCLSAHRSFPLGSSSPSVRARSLTLLYDAIMLAADLGIRIVQIAGYDVESGPSTAESQRLYVDGLRQGLVWAGEQAVLLGLENQETGYIDSPTTALQVVRQLDSPYLQLYMDIGNLVVNQRDVLHEISAARGHLFAVHVKDARPGVPRRVPFGEGDVPFENAFRQLAAIGFRGPVMIEMWNEDKPDALAICAAARHWIASRLEQAYGDVGTGL